MGSVYGYLPSALEAFTGFLEVVPTAASFFNTPMLHCTAECLIGNGRLNSICAFKCSPRSMHAGHKSKIQSRISIAQSGLFVTVSRMVLFRVTGRIGRIFFFGLLLVVAIRVSLISGQQGKRFKLIYSAYTTDCATRRHTIQERQCIE